MIMAGGAGTRLWPMSRRDRPKQLLPIINGRTLLEVAAERLEGVVPPERRLICTAKAHLPTIRSSLPEYGEDQLLCEPVGRDTVNAIGFTAAVLQKRNPDAIFAVLTADHIIEPLDEFRRKLALAFELVEDDPTRLITFSIMPTSPATAYGYVEKGEAIPEFPGAYQCLRFVEKPDAKTAQRYLDAGRYDWNSGMFVFSASRFLEALEWFKPESYAGIRTIADAWDTPEQQQVLEQVYPTLPRTSVDYAVMEPAARDERLDVCTVAMGVWWMDVGSWTSYGETLTADAHGCRSNTSVHHLDSRHVLAVSDNPRHTIATIGCNDLIVVHTADVTLVCPAAYVQQVKELAELVDERLR